MLQFKNRTPFQGTFLLIPDRDGVETIYVIIKATFALRDSVVPADQQLPIAFEDEFNGEPGRGSLKRPSDISMTKLATDVLLIGTAYAPYGQRAAWMDVSLAVGPVVRAVRVFGDRFWRSGFLRNGISEPQPFERMPLVWERAFGGTDVVDGREPITHVELRNPVGQGFRAKGGQKPFDGLPLPNLEDPAQLISRWRDRPAPANFGPICPHWEPRRSCAGTYDAAWEAQRAPYLPKDFDPRFLQVSPPPQTAPGYLAGGEAVEIVGATPCGHLRFELPRHRIRVIYQLDSGRERREADLDTVLLEPDLARLVLTWRAALQTDKRSLRVREIVAMVASA